MQISKGLETSESISPATSPEGHRESDCRVLRRLAVKQAATWPMSLSPLQQRKGKRNEASELLTPIYGRLTDDVGDLVVRASCRAGQALPGGV
jgi:hypothetical protein